MYRKDWLKIWNKIKIIGIIAVSNRHVPWIVSTKLCNWAIPDRCWSTSDQATKRLLSSKMICTLFLKGGTLRNHRIKWNHLFHLHMTLLHISSLISPKAAPVFFVPEIYLAVRVEGRPAIKKPGWSATWQDPKLKLEPQPKEAPSTVTYTSPETLHHSRSAQRATPASF